MGKDLLNNCISRFSIRKLNVAVCSVLLGTLVMLGTDNKVLTDELTTEVQTAGVASAATPISQDAQLYSTLALMIANKATSETAPSVIDSQASAKTEPSQSTDNGSRTAKSMDSSSQTSEAKNHESSFIAQASLENLVVANG